MATKNDDDEIAFVIDDQPFWDDMEKSAWEISAKAVKEDATQAEWEQWLQDNPKPEPPATIEDEA